MKTEIKRDQLKQIHDIACVDWKKKIVEYGAKNPFSETIGFSEKQIQEMISACTTDQLPIVKEIFDIKDITSDIKTFEDVIKYLGHEDEEVVEYNKLVKANITSHILYSQMTVCITKALNEKHILDWSNTSQRKYYICWHMSPLRLYVVNCDYGLCPVTARFCFKSEELARYASNQFFEIYKKSMV